MANPEKLSIASLKPGDVVSFGHIGELPAFEDLVAEHIDQQMGDLDIEGYYHMTINPRLWAGRVPVKELLRVPKFNGNVQNIRLVKMEGAYERRLTVGQRGNSFPRSHHANPVGGPFAEQQRPMYQGFEFVGDASSSTGWRGQVQAELYYYPVPIAPLNGTVQWQGSSMRDNKWYQETNVYGGLSIVRSVTKPVMVEDAAYLIRHERSKEIGFEVLATAMRNAISTPVRN